MPAITLPDVRQANYYDCGRACLESVLRFHGFKAGEWITELANPVQGMSVDTIEAVLWSAFPNVVRGAMTLSDLAHYTATRRPVICPITYAGGTGHYVAVSRVNAARVYFLDPKYGPQKLRRRGFKGIWYDVETFHEYRNFGLTAWPAPRSKHR